MTMLTAFASVAWKAARPQHCVCSGCVFRGSARTTIVRKMALRECQAKSCFPRGTPALRVMIML